MEGCPLTVNALPIDEPSQIRLYLGASKLAVGNGRTFKANLAERTELHEPD